MTEAQKRILDKVKKLLNLAASDPESNEGKAASKKAGALLAEYDLSMLDISQEEQNNDVGQEEFKNYDTDNFIWEARLVAGLQDTFNIFGAATKEHPRQKNYNFVFFGKERDLIMVSYFFKLVRKIITKKGELEYPKGKSKVVNRTAFQEGMTYSVVRRLKDMHKARVEHHTEACTALVVQDMDDIMKKVSATFGRMNDLALPSRNLNSQEQANAFDKGFEEGKKVNLSTPIGGESKGHSAVK